MVEAALPAAARTAEGRTGELKTDEDEQLGLIDFDIVLLLGIYVWVSSNDTDAEDETEQGIIDALEVDDEVCKLYTRRGENISVWMRQDFMSIGTYWIDLEEGGGSNFSNLKILVWLTEEILSRQKEFGFSNSDSKSI